MKSKLKDYNFLESLARIDNIVAASENAFEELDSIPDRDRLTFTNGFYVNCCALFIDIRGSSQLPQKHTRPKLAKLYRTYLSECVAVINSSINCEEVNIQGDSVWGIFNAPYQRDIDSVFNIAYTLNSLVKFLNWKYQKYGIENIRVGIGIDYGRALMIKAGYSGSAINEVVWMGNVVNRASKLSGLASKTYLEEAIMVSSTVYNNLSEKNQSFLSYHTSYGHYHGDVIRTDMEEWYQENCAPKHAAGLYKNI